MQITKTEIYRFSIPMIPFVIATGVMKNAQNVFIRIHTDEGLYGVGECSAFPMIVGETQDTCLALARDFAGIWKGKDPLAIEQRMKELDAYVAHNATIKSAFDLALHDLAAKKAGQPLYKFLGGEKRPVQTDITIGIGDTEAMIEQARDFKASGATILKVKLGKDPKKDLERISGIRKAVGGDIKIRIDANQGWSFYDAVRVLREIEPLDIEFCEQPMPRSYDDFLPELVEISPVKIMADESCFDHHDARKLIKANACDYINIKFAKCGGITEAMRIYQTASEAKVDCMIGGMLESRLALTAKLHFALACPSIKFFDLDTCLLGHLEDPILDGVSIRNYFLDFEELPGIGADVDEGFLRTCESWTI